MPHPKISTRLFLRSSSIVRYRAKALLPSQSLLANTFGVRVHDFTSDVSTKVSTTSYNSTTFNWQDTDKIGVFPLTVDDGNALALQCFAAQAVTSSAKIP